MESNNVAMPLSEGEMWVSFVFEPEYPAEGDIIPIHVQMQRSLAYCRRTNPQDL
jgi:hypothetical protein